MWPGKSCSRRESYQERDTQSIKETHSTNMSLQVRNNVLQEVVILSSVKVFSYGKECSSRTSMLRRSDYRNFSISPPLRSKDFMRCPFLWTKIKVLESTQHPTNSFSTAWVQGLSVANSRTWPHCIASRLPPKEYSLNWTGIWFSFFFPLAKQNESVLSH